MDSDSDGVYDGIDECPSSNNPSPSDMDKSSEVDSTGCFIDAAEGESDSGSAAVVVGLIVVIGLVVFVGRLALLLELEGADVLLPGLEGREAGHGAPLS